MKFRARWIVFGSLAAGLGWLGFTFGPTVVGLQQRGFFEKPPEKEEYHGNVDDNLHALYTAMNQAHDSDGQYPEKEKWMDAISNRLQTSTMKDGEGEKKLHDPSAKSGYGFAFNKAVAGKYKGDLKAPESLVLIYQSKQTSKNAFGDPKTDFEPNRNHAISVTGKILKLNP